MLMKLNALICQSHGAKERSQNSDGFGSLSIHVGPQVHDEINQGAFPMDANFDSCPTTSNKTRFLSQRKWQIRK